MAQQPSKKTTMGMVAHEYTQSTGTAAQRTVTIEVCCTHLLEERWVKLMRELLGSLTLTKLVQFAWPLASCGVPLKYFLIIRKR